jgi:hypothetical protein
VELDIVTSITYRVEITDSCITHLVVVLLLLLLLVVMVQIPQ